MNAPARHYLDHASTTPLRPEAVAAIRTWLESGETGDPARLHAEGSAVRVAIEEARETVAVFFGVRPRQVIFTSGGTEAVHAATWGASRVQPGGAMLCPAVEHSCVLEASRFFGRAEIVPVSADGTVDPEAIAKRLRDRPSDDPVTLVHCQLANHEVGVVQPVGDVAALCNETGVLLHCDAAAAAGHISFAFDDVGADLMSVSSHKLGGPPGVGALLLRKGLRIAPLLGGAQERNRRGGMENTVGILGFAAALRALASPESSVPSEESGAPVTALATEAMHQTRLIEQIIAATTTVPGMHLAGPTDPARRLPHIACFTIDGVLGEPVLLGLEAAGIAVHSGSSCSSETLEPSPVLEAMGLDSERTLRVSVGWSSTEADTMAFAERFPEVVARLRDLATS